MLIAFALWILGLFGVAPGPETLQQYELDFQERGHHIGVDFGASRGDLGKQSSVTLAYEYLVDRRYNGVSFDLMGQVFLKDRKADYWVGGGIGYHPIRELKLFMHAGALMLDNLADTAPGPDVQAQGRLGLGYRMMFFKAGVMPFVYVASTTSGIFSWSLGCRIQY